MKKAITIVKSEKNLLDFDATIEKSMRDVQVARIMKTDYFLEMLKTKRNILAPVCKWDDVYEGYIANVKIANVNNHDLLDGVYGQCWSFRTEASELMWKARTAAGSKYNDDAVLIETTVYNLAKSITLSPSGRSAVSGVVRLGAVEYVEQKVSNKGIVSATSSYANFMDSLFVKRRVFSDEKELRLIIDVANRSVFQTKGFSCNVINGLLCYEIHDLTMILKVVCHPKMDSKRVEEIRQEVARSGWTIPIVEQSELYNLPSRVFKILNP